MAKFVSSRNRVASNALKRKPKGTVIIRHGGREDIEFTRVAGGWRRQRMDVTSETPRVVSSTDVANECNKSVGCKDSWAKVY